MATNIRIAGVDQEFTATRLLSEKEQRFCVDRPVTFLMSAPKNLTGELAYLRSAYLRSALVRLALAFIGASTASFQESVSMLKRTSAVNRCLISIFTVVIV